MTFHTRPRVRLLVSVVLAGLTLAAFSPVLRNSFVDYDDGPYITENVQVRRGITGAGLAWAFTATEADNWHPLTWLSHMLDVQLWGLDPRAHHATSLLLHALNAVLLFLLLEGMTGALWPSAVVGALFAVHPLHVESVAWAAERKDVLSFLFLVATLAAYHRHARRPGPGRYALVALCFALGLMAKPMLVTLPFVLLLLDYWPLGRTGNLVREKLPLLALAAASSAMTLIAQGRGAAISSFERLPLPLRAVNATISYVSYLVDTVWPIGLAVFYPHPQDRVVWAWGAVACVAIAAVTYLVVRYRNYPFLVVGWFWYLGTLVPVIGLVQVGVQAMADRYTYIPLTGVFIMAAWGSAAVGARLRPWTAPAAIAVLLSLSLATFFQAGTWRNSFTLFSHAIAVTEGNAVAHNGVGNAFFREGRYAEAEHHYREAARLEPENPDYHFNLGLALEQGARWDEAGANFRRALQRDARRPAFHNSLGRVLQRTGNIAEASRHYRRAIELDGDYALPRIGEGLLQLRRGNYAAAAVHLREATRLQPGSAEIAAALSAAESGLRRTAPSQP